MSGHSKWATTKRAKAVVDAKRSSLFTKLAKNISIAAREGADPKTNFKLRMAIDKARAFSMPKDNIERAVAKGSGTGEGAHLESALYEGFGPGGVAIMVEAITDNKNRTVSEVKNIFSKHGGNLGNANSVGWMFERVGSIALENKNLSDEQELSLIDAGANDIVKNDDATMVITPLENLQKVKEVCEKLGLTVSEASLVYNPKEQVAPQNPDGIVSLLEALDDLDDVNAVYTNANV